MHFNHFYHFYHRDIHIKNICFIKIDKKYINLKDVNYKINTFVYIFSIIDYESVISYKFKLNDLEKKK